MMSLEMQVVSKELEVCIKDMFSLKGLPRNITANILIGKRCMLSSMHFPFDMSHGGMD